MRRMRGGLDAGRRCGVVVPDVEEAISQLEELSQQNGEHEDMGP